jgi:hypothetical protein
MREAGVLILLDTNAKQWEQAPAELGPDVEIGQLLTPLTRYSDRGTRYAIDNGAFAGFDAKAFGSLLARQKDSRDRCIFVAAPDVVGSARRTLEVFTHWYPKLCGWPLALVAQDGQGGLPIPWSLLTAIFIGGSTTWKLGRHAERIIKAAKAMGKWVHVGRVNGPERFDKFAALGVDSIDGSGISQYSHMRKKLTAGVPLFEKDRCL